MSDQTIAAQWDSWSDDYFKRQKDYNHILTDPALAFHRTTWAVIMKYLPDLKGKQVLVPSSGENYAAFAFAVLGAQEVTSCDISPRQIENAKAIAEQYKLNVQFQIEDTMRLDGIKDNRYDLVYMSEGALVWLGDIEGMFLNIARVLKPGGLFINYEIHPISRPFKDKFGKLAVKKPYSDIIVCDEGEVCTKYHWRLQDILNAMCRAGLTLQRLEEMSDEKDRGHFWFYADKRAKMSQKKIDAYYDWRKNPQAGLPHWFTVCAARNL